MCLCVYTCACLWVWVRKSVCMYIYCIRLNDGRLFSILWLIISKYSVTMAYIAYRFSRLLFIYGYNFFLYILIFRAMFSSRLLLPKLFRSLNTAFIFRCFSYYRSFEFTGVNFTHSILLANNVLLSENFQLIMDYLGTKASNYATFTYPKIFNSAFSNLLLQELN